MQYVHSALLTMECHICCILCMGSTEPAMTSLLAQEESKRARDKEKGYLQNQGLPIYRATQNAGAYMQLQLAR